MTDAARAPNLLRAHLADHDEPCPQCGYNLRGSDGQLCSECGAPLTWPLRPRVPLGWWRSGLVAMVITYISLLVLAMSFFRGNWAGIVAVLLVVDGPRRIRRWIRTPRAFAGLRRDRKQWAIAGWWLAALITTYLAAIYALIDLGIWKRR